MVAAIAAIRPEIESSGTWTLSSSPRLSHDFVAKRQDNRIGLVVFRQEALQLSPPTTDYGAVENMLKDIENYPLPDGTAIGLGIDAAVGPKTIYKVPPARRVSLAPVVARDRRAFSASIRF